jgi:hypothetical protein
MHGLEQRVSVIAERYEAMTGPAAPKPTKVKEVPIDPYKYAYRLMDELRKVHVYACRRRADCACDGDCDCDDDDYTVTRDWKLLELGGTKMQLTCHVDAVVKCDKKNNLRFFRFDADESEVPMFDITWSQRQLTVYVSGGEAIGYAMEDAPTCQLGSVVITFDAMQFTHAVHDELN